MYKNIKKALFNNRRCENQKGPDEQICICIHQCQFIISNVNPFKLSKPQFDQFLYSPQIFLHFSLIKPRGLSAAFRLNLRN